MCFLLRAVLFYHVCLGTIKHLLQCVKPLCTCGTWTYWLYWQHFTLPCLPPGQCDPCTLFPSPLHMHPLVWEITLTCFHHQSSVYTEYIEAGAPVIMVVHKEEWKFKELRTADSWSLQPMFYLCLHCAVLAAFDLVLGWNPCLFANMASLTHASDIKW